MCGVALSGSADTACPTWQDVRPTHTSGSSEPTRGRGQGNPLCWGKVTPLRKSPATFSRLHTCNCELKRVHSNGRPILRQSGTIAGRPTFAHCFLDANRPCESLGPLSVRHVIANGHAGLSPSRERCLPPDFSPVQLDLVTNDRRDKHEQDSSKCPPNALSAAAQWSELSRYVLNSHFRPASRAADAPDLTFTISAKASIVSCRLTAKKSFSASR